MRIATSLLQPNLVEMFEDLKKEGKSLSQAKIIPLVNIWVYIPHKVDQIDMPNNIALFFTGDKYRYYVHVDGTKLKIILKKLDDIKKDDDDWKNHMQFSNNYTNQLCEEGTDASNTDGIPEDKKVSLDPESQSNGDQDQFQSRLTSDGDTTSPVKKKLNMCGASKSLVNSFEIPSEESKHDPEP